MFAAPVVFNATLSPAQITHAIYHPKDRDVHRPYFSDTKLHRKSMVPAVKAIGSATFLYHPKTHELEYAIAFSNLSSPPVMIHLQMGYPHQDGLIIATIATKAASKKNLSFQQNKRDRAEQENPENRSGFISGVITLKRTGDLHSHNAPQKEEQMLMQGGCYISIHTHLNELGELRGQLQPLSSTPLNMAK